VANIVQQFNWRRCRHWGCTQVFSGCSWGDSIGETKRAECL